MSDNRYSKWAKSPGIYVQYPPGSSLSGSLRQENLQKQLNENNMSENYLDKFISNAAWGSGYKDPNKCLKLEPSISVFITDNGWHSPCLMGEYTIYYKGFDGNNWWELTYEKITHETRIKRIRKRGEIQELRFDGYIYDESDLKTICRLLNINS